MRCEQCGQQVPTDANFCPSCGAKAPIGDATTAAIELGAFDPEHQLEELPDVPAGAGILVVVRGPNAGSRFLLDQDETSVGRHPDADIFLDDVTVSRRHAVLALSDEGITVRDLGSLNGTYVDGDRVEERTLRGGEELQVGRFKLLFVGEASGPIEAATPADSES